MPTLAPFSGKFLVRGGQSTVIEGEWPFERTVILEFPSRADAEGWYSSPAHQEILLLRLGSMICNASSLIAWTGPAVNQTALNGTASSSKLCSATTSTNQR